MKGSACLSLAHSISGKYAHSSALPQLSSSLLREVEAGIFLLLTAEAAQSGRVSSYDSAKITTEDRIDYVWDLAHSLRWMYLSSSDPTVKNRQAPVPAHHRLQRLNLNPVDSQVRQLVRLCRNHLDPNLDVTTLVLIADSVHENIIPGHLALAARQISALLLALPDRLVPASRLDEECEALLNAFDSTKDDIGTGVDVWDAIESLHWRWSDAWERIGGASFVSTHNRESFVSAFVQSSAHAQRSEKLQPSDETVRLRRIRHQDGTVGGLSDDLKQLILAGEDADSNDEQDDDPFAELRGDTQREAGFEEELEEVDEPAGIWRRQNVSRLTGVRANARDWRRRLEDYEESEEEAEEEHASSSTKGALQPISGAEAERAGQRTLIRFYADHGKAPFERTQEARKSAGRKQLKELLGSTWDDGTIESWCVMFERNVSAESFVVQLLFAE